LTIIIDHYFINYKKNHNTSEISYPGKTINNKRLKLSPPFNILWAIDYIEAMNLFTRYICNYLIVRGKRLVFVKFKNGLNITKMVLEEYLGKKKASHLWRRGKPNVFTTEKSLL